MVPVDDWTFVLDENLRARRGRRGQQSNDDEQERRDQAVHEIS
jgi:hypothetical protein